MLWIHLLWICLHLLQFLDFLQFFYLLFHSLPYQICILHSHSAVTHGIRPTTRSYSTGKKYDCRGIKWFEYHYGVKHYINGPCPFCQWFLRTNIVIQLTSCCNEGNTLSILEYSLLLFPPNKPIQMTPYTYQQFVQNG